MGDNGEDLGTTLLKHVEDTLHSEETVGVLLLSNAFEEDGQVVMVIELHNVHLPLDLILGSVLNADGQVSAVVEAAELGGHDSAALDSTSLGSSNKGYFLGLGEGGSLASNSGALLESGFALNSNRGLSSLDVGNGQKCFILAGHVVLGEVTEAGVLGLGQELVLREFPGLAIGLGDDLLQVVFSDHRRSEVDLGHGHRLNVTHCIFKVEIIDVIIPKKVDSLIN